MGAANLIQRGPFTNKVVTFLRSELAIAPAVPVGLGSIPSGAGWIGNPGAPTSKFQAYATVMPLTASVNQGAIADSQSDWILPYSFGGYSVDPAGPEAVLDRTRLALLKLRGWAQLLGTDTYKVIRVQLESLGGLTRVDQVDPPFWGQIDTVSFWLAKEL